MDVLTGSLPLDSVSRAAQPLLTDALDSGIVTACPIFAGLAIVVLGLAAVLLREVQLDDG